MTFLSVFIISVQVRKNYGNYVMLTQLKRVKPSQTGGRVQEHVTLLDLVRGQGSNSQLMHKWKSQRLTINCGNVGRADLVQGTNASRLIPSTSAVHGTIKYVLLIPVCNLQSYTNCKSAGFMFGVTTV